MSKKLVITKAIVAEVFEVSRSAVTQSTKSKPLATDVRARIIRYLFPRDFSSYLWRSLSQRKMLELLKKFKEVMHKRGHEYQGKGRPAAKANFTAFKRLVREIIKQFDLWDRQCKDGFEEYPGTEITEVLYGLNAIVHKAWGCIAYNGKTMDYSLE